jgi:hypothetical protein
LISYIKKNKKGIIGTRKKTNKAPLKTNTLGISPKVLKKGAWGRKPTVFRPLHVINWLSILTVPRKTSLAYTAPTKLSLS